MRHIKLFTCFLLLLIQANAQQPTIKILESGKRVSIRGLSVVNDNIIWASGNNGSVARSTDGGVTWLWQTIPGYEKRDFRDIEAFDENTAIIMGVAEPAIILKTKISPPFQGEDDYFARNNRGWLRRLQIMKKLFFI